MSRIHACQNYQKLQYEIMAANKDENKCEIDKEQKEDNIKKRTS